MLLCNVDEGWHVTNSLRKPLSKNVTVAVSPYQTARGPLVKLGPGEGEATVNVGTTLVHGKCLSLTMAVSAA
jgi:hypothetical protein